MIRPDKQAFQSRHFISLPYRDGLLIDFSKGPHPTKMYGWGHNGEQLELGDEGTHFGFVVEGSPTLIGPDFGCGHEYNLGPGMYFCVPGTMRIEGGSGIAISRLGYHGIFSIGGPIEERGRMRYIDGCTDSLLLPPVLKGDPCLNHLHFPPQIDQTRHTHPSIRVGVVASGRGRCVVPANDDGTGPDVPIALVPGALFVIPTGGQHSFFTDDETMDVIAYHPDSDTGPQHDDHPMVNRTLVDGVSASGIEKIRTSRSEFEQEGQQLSAN